MAMFLSYGVLDELAELTGLLGWLGRIPVFSHHSISKPLMSPWTTLVEQAVFVPYEHASVGKHSSQISEPTWGYELGPEDEEE